MLHLSTIDEPTWILLKRLFGIDDIKKEFALAGGTSLALQIGHRKSIDLDFFNTDRFNVQELEAILASEPGITFSYSGSNSRMHFSEINHIKCGYRYG